MLGSHSSIAAQLGCWRRVVWYIATFRMADDFIFKAKRSEESKGMFYPEDAGTTFRRNLGNCLPVDTA
jgi:hypothetical protein